MSVEMDYDFNVSSLEEFHKTLSPSGMLSHTRNRRLHRTVHPDAAIREHDGFRVAQAEDWGRD